MPTPSYAQAWSQIRAVKDLLVHQQTMADSFTTDESALTSTLQYVAAADGKTREWYADFRRNIGTQMDESAIQRAFEGPLESMMYALGYVPGTFEENARRLRDYMVANTDTVKRYGLTYGSMGTLNGTGTSSSGRILRRVTDKNGNQSPGGAPETKTFFVESLTRYAETFVVDGDPKDANGLTQSASGLSKEDAASLTSLNADDSTSYLTNPTFQKRGEQPTDDASGDKVLDSDSVPSGWTIDTPANCFSTAQSSKVYRGAANNNLPIGLGFTGDVNITQDLLTQVNPDFDPEAIYLLALVLWIENGSVDGDFDVSLGAKSFTTVGLATLAASGAGFYPQAIGYFTLAEINQLTRVLEFDITNKLTTDEAVISDLIVAPGTLIDGTWHWSLGGRDIFIDGDYFEVTDTYSASGSGELDEWLVRRSGLAAEGIVLPTTTGTPTIAD